MAAKIGVKIALDGEREFKQSLKACKDEVKLYRDELKELDEKFKTGKATLDDYKTKVDTLKEKQKALTDQLDAAKRGLQNANEQYDKQKTKLNDLETEYKEAKEALEKLKDESGEGSEAFKKQAEKVDALKEAVSKQTEVVNTSKTRTNQWTAEIKSSKKALEDCEKELGQAETELKEAGDAADKSGDKFDDFADSVEITVSQTEKLSTGLKDMVVNKIVDLAGDALVKLGEKAIDAAKYIVQVGSDFEAQMSKVASISGATAEDTAKLTEKAAEMGRTTKFTATEAGQGLEYMAMAGWKTEDMLNGLDGIMMLAAASGEDLGTTSDIVTDALTAFGESAGESGRLADIMATASSNANTNVSMMGETFKYAAPVAGALGYSMEDTAVAIGLMANAGIKASQAGTSLRGGLTNLVRPVGDCSIAMTKYGISVTDTDGKMLTFRDLMVQLREKLGGLSEEEQAAAVSAIFGKNAMSGWLAVVNASDSDFDKLTTAVDNSAGAAERMATQMNDNLQGKLTLMNSAIEGLGVALYNYFSGPLQDVVELATGFINGLTGLITPHKTELESFIDGIEKSNKEVEKSIEHTKSTVSNAESRVAELSAYKDEIGEVLTKCDNFNKIDLGDGYYKIVDSTGRVVEEGFEPLGTSVTSTEDIIKKFGSDGFKTDKIKEGTDTVAEFFDADGKKIGEAKTELDKFGKAKIDTKNIDDGTKVVISCFSDAGEKVTDFETTVNGTELEFHTDGITSGIDTAVDYIGHVTTEIDSVETRLENFAENGINTKDIKDGKTLIVQYFNEAGEEIETVEGKITDIGTVQMPIEGSGIETGTNAIITCFDNASGSVQSFRTDVETLATGSLDLSTITTELEKVQDSIQTTYTITDEFTRAKIESMISNLGGAVGELAEAWNSETGELTASKEEMEDWFDTAKEVAMYHALEDSINELYSAWGEAAVNVAKANSATKQAKEEWEKAHTALQEFIEEHGGLTGVQSHLGLFGQAVDSVGDEYLKLMEAEGRAMNACDDARDAQEKANATLDEANIELQTNSDTLTELKNIMGEATGANQDNKKSVEEATAAVEGLDEANDNLTGSTQNVIDSTDELTKKQQEAIDNYADLFGITEESFRNIAEQWTGTKEEFAEWCADQESKLEGLQKDYENTFKSIRDSIAGYITTLDAADKDGKKSLDNMLANLKEHVEDVRKWGENMEFLGQQIGTGFTQEMYDAMAALGPEKSAETVQLLVDALRSEDPQVRAKAVETAQTYADNLTLSDKIANTVANYTTSSVQLNAALEQGFVDGSEHFKDTVVEVAKSGANAAEQTASDFGTAGKKAGQEEAQGLRNEELGVKQASEAVVNAAKSAAETATENFERVGEVSMTYLTRGMSNRSTFPSDKVKEIINSAKQEADVKAADFQNTGQAIVNSIANGVSQNSGYYSSLWNAVSAAVNNAKSAVDNTAYQMSEAGQSMMNALANGIRQYGYLAWNAGDGVGNQARSSLNWHINTFEGAGQEMDYGLAQGLVDKASYVSEMASNVAWNAFIAAKNRLGIASPSKEFEKLGKYSDEGMAGGFRKNQAVVENAARESAKSAMEAAQDELSGSDYYTDLTGKISYAGAEQLNRIANARVETADTASAMRSLTSGMSALRAFAESLQNPQSPNVTVMIGGKEFKGYIVKTASEGMAQQRSNLRMGVGA